MEARTVVKGRSTNSSKLETFPVAYLGIWLALWTSIVDIYETPVELAFCFAEGMTRDSEHLMMDDDSHLPLYYRYGWDGHEMREDDTDRRRDDVDQMRLLSARFLYFDM